MGSWTLIVPDGKIHVLCSLQVTPPTHLRVGRITGRLLVPEDAPELDENPYYPLNDPSGRRYLVRVTRDFFQNLKGFVEYTVICGETTD